MLRQQRGREDDRDHTGTLEVFDVQVVDEPPPGHGAPARRSCRWHIWHRWALVRVDTRTTYVACTVCGRLHAPTIFEPPIP